jgi:hypothetical protein
MGKDETDYCSCELSKRAPAICLWHNSMIWPALSESDSLVGLLAIFCLESSRRKGAMCRQLLDELGFVQKQFIAGFRGLGLNRLAFGQSKDPRKSPGGP